MKNDPYYFNQLVQQSMGPNGCNQYECYA